MSNSLRPHELQHARLPCPSPTHEFTETHVHWVGDPSSHHILCCPIFLMPPIPPSITVFSNESTLHMRWPTYWSFSFTIIPSKEHPSLISFRMDWLDLLAVQGTLKSFLQHHSSKALILHCSAFFTVQLSHSYITTGETTALTRLTLSFPFNCFPYLFAFIVEEGFLISPCYSLELDIQMGLSFLFSFAFYFFSQLFVRPPQTAILPFCVSFSWGWSWSLPPIQCHEPLSIVVKAL